MLALSPDYYPVLASDLAVERGRRKHLESKKRERGENIRSGEVGEGVKAREGANDKKYGRGVMDQRKRGEGEDQEDHQGQIGTEGNGMGGMS